MASPTYRPTPQEHLDGLHEHFKRGNPLGAWAAWEMCRRLYDVPVPLWVLGYIDDCAKQLSASYRADDPDWPGQPEQRLGPVAKRLGFKTSLSTARRDLYSFEMESIAIRVLYRMYDEGVSMDKACRDLPGASRKKALEAMKRRSWIVNEAMATLIREATGGPEPPPEKVLDVFKKVCRERGKSRGKRRRPSVPISASK